jgi:integrase/recombinase XerD
MSSQTNALVKSGGNPAIRLLDEKIREQFLTSYGNLKTKSAYDHSLGQFKTWLLSLPDDYKAINLLSDFRSHLYTQLNSSDSRQRLSEYSVSLYLAVIKKYAKFLYLNGLIDFDPGATVKGFKRNANHNRRALDRNIEVPLLLDTIDKSGIIGTRDNAMITLLVYTGIRGFELLSANYGDLDSVEGRTILWVRSKGKLGKSEYVFVTEAPLKALSTYLGHRKGLNSGSPLFTTSDDEFEQRISTRTLRERVDYWLKKAGLKSARVTTHSLRHTAAISALKNGADIRAVQGMLRHSDPKTTMVYLQDISRQDKPAEDAIRFGVTGA